MVLGRVRHYGVPAAGLIAFVATTDEQGVEDIEQEELRLGRIKINLGVNVSSVAGARVTSMAIVAASVLLHVWDRPTVSRVIHVSPCSPPAAGYKSMPPPPPPPGH